MPESGETAGGAGSGRRREERPPRSWQKTQDFRREVQREPLGGGERYGGEGQLAIEEMTANFIIKEEGKYVFLQTPQRRRPAEGETSSNSEEVRKSRGPERREGRRSWDRRKGPCPRRRGAHPTPPPPSEEEGLLRPGDAN